jgi:glycosyltransferase involved in cell wall biosynthesis
MNRFLFSVVTVTLNCVQDVGATAQSVLAQDFGNYEYIVKDGGSTDGTVERLRELGLPVHVENDSGIFDAMNQALLLCKGEYICFLNAGDLFFANDILTRVAEQLQQNRFPKFMFGDICSLNEAPFIKESLQRIQYPDRLSRLYLYRKTICHQSWFVHRSLLLRENGFNTKFQFSADYDFLLKIILRDRVGYLHIPSKIIIYKGNGVTEMNSHLLPQEKGEIQKIYYSIWERIIYTALYNTVWFLAKHIVYQLYPILPTYLKERAAGW